MIKAESLDDAIDIAKDIVKEHNFSDYSIEKQSPQDVRAYANKFLKPVLT